MIGGTPQDSLQQKIQLKNGLQTLLGLRSAELLHGRVQQIQGVSSGSQWMPIVWFGMQSAITPFGGMAEPVGWRA
jgi:hypothetical protein